MNPNTPTRDLMPMAAIAAMALAVAAAVLIGGRSPQTPVAPNTTSNAAPIASVTPVELARELLAAPTDLQLVDLRAVDTFAHFHLPRAQNVPAAALAGPAGSALFASKPRRVVLYGDGANDADEAAFALQRRGHPDVHVLAGGLEAFREAILVPPSLRAGTTEAASKAAAATWNLQRAFFLGNRQPNPLATWATDPTDLAAPTVVSPAWLAARLGKVAVLDVRKRDDFLALHIPGAQLLELGKLRQKAGDRDLFLLGPEVLAAQFGALGVTATTPVVLVADEKLQDATLAAIMLLRVGHQALAILEGGLVRWATEQRPLVATVAAPTPATYTPRAPADDFAIEVDALAKAVQQGGTQVLDVRPPEFFRGEKSTEARPGHIPGAKNRPFEQDFVRTEDGLWFRPRAELAKEYAALGLQQEQPIAVHCRTGHTASESYFVLRYLLGYPQVRWYNGSWTEWASRQDLPAVTGGQ